MSKPSKSEFKRKGFGVYAKFRLLMPERPSLLVKPSSNFRSSSQIHLEPQLAKSQSPIKVVYAKRGVCIGTQHKSQLNSRSESTHRGIKLQVFRTLSTDEMISSVDSVKFPRRTSAKILRSRATARSRHESKFTLNANGLRPDFARIQLQSIYTKTRRHLKVDMSTLAFNTVATETEDTSFD